MASKVRRGWIPVAGVAGCLLAWTATAQARGRTPQLADEQAVKELMVGIRQRDSAEGRTAAVAKAREMLKGDARAQATALYALAGAADVKFDRAGLEEAVAGLLASPSADVRDAALRTLPTVGPKPSRIEDEAKLAGDPDPQVRAGVMQSIVFTRRANHIETPVEEPALTLLGDQDPDVVRETARGLWGVPLTPKLEAKVIELSRFPEGKVPSFSSMQYDMMYYVLSTRPALGKAVAQRLWEIARNPLLDRNWTGRAVWGLAHESSPEAADVVTKALTEELDNSLVAYEREWAVRGLAMAKTPEAKKKLEEVAEHDDSDDLRKLAKDVMGNQ